MTSKAANLASAALKFLTVGLVNTCRRLVILGRYVLICWQQQRLRRAWRRLGREAHLALEAGEVNPMLTESVKDAVKKAQAVKAAKERQYQAVAALRGKIRAAKSGGPRPAEPVSPGEERTEQGEDEKQG